MKTALLTLAVLATLPLLTFPALAAINDEWDLEEDGDVYIPETVSHTGRQSTATHEISPRSYRSSSRAKANERSSSAEVFYGSDKSDNEIDIWGAAFRETVCREDASVRDVPILPEFFAVLRVGAGEESWTYEDAETTVTAFLVTLGVGGGLRAEISKTFSVFVRGEVGVAVEHAEYDLDCDGEHADSDRDSDVGLLLGIGIGAQFNIGEHCGILVAVDWFKTSCEALKSLGADKMEYTTFSVGYKWSF